MKKAIIPGSEFVNWALLRCREPLGPEEHAAGGMEWLAFPREHAAFVLEPAAASAVVDPAGACACRHTTRVQLLALMIRQLDLAHPQADGRASDSEATFNLSHREPFAPELSGHFPFDRFHF
jgi:hypothetical protein